MRPNACSLLSLPTASIRSLSIRPDMPDCLCVLGLLTQQREAQTDSHVRNGDGQKDDGFAGKQLVKGTRGKEKRAQSEEMGRCFNGILLTGWVGM